MNQNINLFYGFESLLGAIGIYPLLMNLFRLENPNPLEKKIKWIFFSMMSLFLVRFPFQAFNYQFSKRLTYAVATIFIFTVFLYFETLLRRHMPLILKIFATFFTCVFIVDTLFLDFVKVESHLIAFGIYALILQTSVVLLALFRKKNDYTKSENSLINITMITVIVLGIFFLSDVKIFHEFLNMPHFGVLGALLFTYAAFHDQAIMTNNYVYLKKIIKVMIFSSFLVVVLITLLPSYDETLLTHSFILFMIVNLVIRIHFLAKELEGNDNFFKFVERVVEADKDSLLLFLKEIQTFFQRVETKLLSQTDLMNYDLKKFNSFFDKNSTHLFSAFDLRSRIQEKDDLEKASPEDLEIMEQMIDILERFEMSHLCRVNSEHTIFIVFNFHLMGRSSVVYTQTALISEVAKIFNKK